MATSIRLVGISGSLRSESYNTALLRVVGEVLPEGVTFTVLSLRDIPFYDGDLDLPIATERPEPVERLRRAIAEADGLVIASPEYNYSIPGGLKNAIDWASRGPESPLVHKPVALMGGSPGLWGSIRMQMAFLPVFQAMAMQVVQKPEVLVSQINKKFDENGRLTDETTRELVRKKIQALVDLALTNKPR